MNWTITEGVTNGKAHALHIGYYKGILVNVSTNEDVHGARLGINGYGFEYPSVDAAKADAPRRINNNAGVYLQSYEGRVQ